LALVCMFDSFEDGGRLFLRLSYNWQAWAVRTPIIH
jgi:hypothetical protein